MRVQRLIRMRANTRIGAAVAAFAVLAAGCASAHAVPRPGGAPGVPVSRGVAARVAPADARPYAAADMAFGLSLLRAWCQATPRRNLVFSPAALASSLGMAYLGARGATAAAMGRVLHLPRLSPGLLAGLRARTGVLSGLGGPGAAVTADDRLWADPSLPTSASFLDALATAYQAGVARVPTLRDPVTAARLIDDAVAATTGGQIRHLIAPDDLSQVGWVLTSAVYLRALWQTPFEADQTFNEPFTSAGGRPVTASFMHAAGVRTGFAYGWTSVTLPYRAGKLALTALLPPASAGPCQVPAAATVRDLVAAHSAGTVALPKVSLRTSGSAASLLAGMGMAIAFGNSADFTGISRRACCIGFVRQTAILRVDEKGTTAAAAAATGIVATTGAAPVGRQVVCDRPYLLLITSSDGEPLFLARVADPTAN